MVAEVLIAEIAEVAKEQRYTLEAFFELEEKSPYKNEFLNGKIIQMPGSSINHNRISRNVLVQLSISAMENENLEVFSGDQIVFLPEYQSTTYPDVCVVVGTLEKLNKRAISNPTLIVEVASDSTVKYDRGEKFIKYQTLPSFQEYVLIDQDTPSVEVFYKSELGWLVEIYLGMDEIIELKSIDTKIKMTDIYKNVENLQHPQGKMDLEERLEE